MTIGQYWVKWCTLISYCLVNDIRRCRAACWWAAYRPCPRVPISPAWADGATCAEWLGILSPCMSGLDTYRNTGYTPGSTNDTCTISLNTPSSPIPLPLGLHALPLRSLDRVRPQADPTSPFERRVVQHTHSTYSINGSSATSTNLPPPRDYTYWASLWSRPQHWCMKQCMHHPRQWTVNHVAKSSVLPKPLYI